MGRKNRERKARINAGLESPIAPKRESIEGGNSPLAALFEMVALTSRAVMSSPTGSKERRNKKGRYV